MSRYKKIRCPNCGRVITESELDYDFSTAQQPTNRYFCTRCKKMVFYTVKAKKSLVAEQR